MSCDNQKSRPKRRAPRKTDKHAAPASQTSVLLVTSPEFHGKIAPETALQEQSQHTTHKWLRGPPAEHGRAFRDHAVISFGSSHSPTNSTSLLRTHIYTGGVRNNRAGLEFDQLHHEIRSLWFHTHNTITKLLEVIPQQRFGEVVGQIVLRP